MKSIKEVAVYVIAFVIAFGLSKQLFASDFKYTDDLLIKVALEVLPKKIEDEISVGTRGQVYITDKRMYAEYSYRIKNPSDYYLRDLSIETWNMIFDSIMDDQLAERCPMFKEWFKQGYSFQEVYYWSDGIHWYTPKAFSARNCRGFM